MGCFSAIVLFAILLQGAMGSAAGSPVVIDGHSLYSQALHVARSGTELLPDFPGVAVRSSLNSLSFSLLGNVHMPNVVMPANDTEQLARLAGVTASKYRLLDSGSAFEVVGTTKTRRR